MVNDVITTIVDVITGLLGGIGEGIVDYFESVFLNSAGTGLNSVGTFIFVLLGIGAAFGLASLVFNMVRSRR
jgi:hypothetical protein